MTDDDLRPVADELRRFEGLVLHLYQDKRGYVTTAIGCRVFDLGQALALPFVKSHPSQLTTYATPAEVAAEYSRICAMPKGLGSKAYAGDLWLLASDAYALTFSRLREMIPDLQGTFPGWPSFPAPARDCLIDLRWNAGSLHHGWPNLLAACNAVPPNWRAAAGDCETSNPDNSPSTDARNAWRRQCFLTAADSVESAPEA
jgi:hypothetical protein